MYGAWKDKRDPTKHPVRYIALLWEQALTKHPRIAGYVITGDKSWGQLTCLQSTLRELAPFVITWIVKPENWWKFTQQVKAETKQYLVPDDPDPGFLVKHRHQILRIMRHELRSSTEPEDIQFCAAVAMRQIKPLLLVYAAGNEELIARIEAAQTITDMHLLFIELVDSQALAA